MTRACGWETVREIIGLAVSGSKWKWGEHRIKEAQVAELWLLHVHPLATLIVCWGWLLVTLCSRKVKLMAVIVSSTLPKTVYIPSANSSVFFLSSLFDDGGREGSKGNIFTNNYARNTRKNSLHRLAKWFRSQVINVRNCKSFNGRGARSVVLSQFKSLREAFLFLLLAPRRKLISLNCSVSPYPARKPECDENWCWIAKEKDTKMRWVER